MIWILLVISIGYNGPAGVYQLGPFSNQKECEVVKGTFDNVQRIAAVNCLQITKVK